MGALGAKGGGRSCVYLLLLSVLCVCCEAEGSEPQERKVFSLGGRKTLLEVKSGASLGAEGGGAERPLRVCCEKLGAAPRGAGD